MTNEKLDALVFALDHMHPDDINTRDCSEAITTLRAQLAEARAERDRFEIALASACLAGGTTHLIGKIALANARADRAEQQVANLEAALAEARAELRHYRHEVVETALANVADEEARADRAEAALAAQIKVDAEIVQFRHDENQIMRKTWATPKLTSLDDVADEIRTQPHDRTALDHIIAQTREKALREAADVVPQGWCAKLNSHKEMDVDLGSAIQNAILALIETDKP